MWGWEEKANNRDPVIPDGSKTNYEVSQELWDDFCTRQLQDLVAFSIVEIDINVRVRICQTFRWLEEDCHEIMLRSVDAPPFTLPASLIHAIRPVLGNITMSFSHPVQRVHGGQRYLLRVVKGWGLTNSSCSIQPPRVPHY
jgi:hypothetical protein